MRNENKLKFQKQQVHKRRRVKHGGSRDYQPGEEEGAGGIVRPGQLQLGTLCVGGQRDSEKLWAKYIRNLHKLTAGIFVRHRIMGHLEQL